ncbi:MAG: acetyl-CoA carboxylase biotin carboxyl carrier protein [Pirellulales bacterium]|nr:acetyl-CoA carboxylase biotin carboxyl carrier protein [Pirellulales bacterium]
MAGPAANAPDNFDVRKLRRLAELMREYELSEIDLRQAGVRICLRKQSGVVTTEVRPVAPAQAVAAPAAPAPAAPVDERNVAVIKSPMIGTFYTSSSPESPPFVKVGDHVGPETTICIIEAMKVFNEIPAEVSGKVVAVLVGNGEPVEFGHPLFKIDTRG